MNNELSFESIFNLGVGNKSFNINTTPSFLSQERFDGFMDSNEADFQNSIESINFINDYEKVNDYNNKLKIKMLNKINKAYGSCNRGLESFIQSIEEETDGSSAIKSENNSESKTEQPAGTSEKKLKWYQKVWESIKKVAIAIWHAIVKVFKTILKIITFGHYGKNKKEKVDFLKKKNEEIEKKVEFIPNNITESTKPEDIPQTDDKRLWGSGNPLTQVKKESLELLHQIEIITGVANKPLSPSEYNKKQQELKKVFATPKVGNNKNIAEVKNILQKAKTSQEIKEANKKIDVILDDLSKNSTSVNPDVAKIEAAVKDAEPKINKLDVLVNRIDKELRKSATGPAAFLPSAKKGKGSAYTVGHDLLQDRFKYKAPVNEAIWFIISGMLKVLSTAEKNFGKSLACLKKVLVAYKENTKSMVKTDKGMINSITFNQKYYDFFVNTCNKILDTNKQLDNGVIDNYDKLVPYLDIFHGDSGYLGTPTNAQKENIRKIIEFGKADNPKVFIETKKLFDYYVSLVGRLTTYEDGSDADGHYYELTIAFNIQASPDFKNFVENQMDSYTTERK